MMLQPLNKDQRIVIFNKYAKDQQFIKFQSKLLDSLKFLDGGSPPKDPLINIVLSVFAAKESIIG